MLRLFHYLLNRSGDVCKLILEYVKDKNPENSYGETPIFTAAYYGNVDAFKLFLELSDEKVPVKRIGMPWTPFHFAFRNSHLEICNIIVKILSEDVSKKKLLKMLLQVPKDLGRGESPKEAIAWLNGLELGLSL